MSDPLRSLGNKLAIDQMAIDELILYLETSSEKLYTNVRDWIKDNFDLKVNSDMFNIRIDQKAISTTDQLLHEYQFDRYAPNTDINFNDLNDATIAELKNKVQEYIYTEFLEAKRFYLSEYRSMLKKMNKTKREIVLKTDSSMINYH